MLLTFDRVLVYRFRGLTIVIIYFFLFTAFGHSQNNVQRHALYPDVTILQSDSRGFTLEYRLREFKFDTLQIDSREFTGISFFGGAEFERSKPDLPDLKFRAITIALPSHSEPDIELLEYDDTVINGVRIPPRGDIKYDEDGARYLSTEGIELRTDSSIPLFTMYDIGEVQGVVLGTIHITPVQLSGSGNSIRIYNRIVIRVSFGQGTFSPIDRTTFDVLRNVVINLDQVSILSGFRSHTEVFSALPSSQQNSVLSSGNWYKIAIEADGIYRVDSSTLQQAGIPVNSIDPRTIKIYGNGGTMLPENILAERPVDLIETAIYVQGESDGNFGSGDYILFYATGTTEWNYNPDSGLYQHKYNCYEGKNYYFLTYGGSQGKRMQSVASLQEPNPIRPQYHISRILHRNPKINLLSSGREWMGESFSPNSVLTFSNTLHGFNPALPVRYRIQVAARASVQTRFRISDQNVTLGTVSLRGIHLTHDTGPYAVRETVATFNRAGTLPDNISELRLEYEAGDQSEGYLEWFEIHYPRNFEAQDDYLKFTSPDTSGVVEYTVQGFSSSQIIAFDVTRHSEVTRITNMTGSGNTIRFQRPQEKGQPSQFIALTASAYRDVGTIESIDNSNLRGITTGAEFIIVVHPEFLSEAERLKRHRETFHPNRLSTIVVNVQHVYNEFSGGLLDPSAIRDFLYHANSTWQVKPRYVLLFGAGSFDYKRHLGQRENYIPTWQTIESFSRLYTYTSDDFFIQFTPNSHRSSMSIGRLNAVNRSDARVMVDKIVHYETNSDFGPWRNRITFIADDGWTPRRDEGNSHTYQAERLATVFTPAAFENDKVYMIEYPFENTAFGRRMPEVNKAIVDRFNNGTLIMNWTGHGNPRVWAYEWIFVKETTIPLLENYNRLTFVTAATCDFSRIDDPREQSGGELLVGWEKGGAIAVLSTTRIVIGTINAIFNYSFYSNLLTPLPNGIYPRIGDALFATKQIRFEINDVKFVLLGDPTLRLHIPTHNASIEKINGEPVVERVTLKALQKVTIEGSIRHPEGNKMEDFNGKMFLVVYDSDKQVSIPKWGGWTFVSTGNVIFRGESSVTQGLYSSSFVIPKDISHEGGPGRIALYFWENEIDGRGFSRSITLGGIDTTVTPDTEGPEITMYLDNRNFRSGDLVSERPLLLVDLFDESGMNISGGGVGHRIEAWLNDGDGIDLTDYYAGVIDSYQKGTIEYQLDELDPGPHHLRMRAWDVYNNSAKSEIFFRVESSEVLALENVYNYPNPFQRETVFTFQHNQIIPLDIEIKIYTVAGRLIAQLRKFSVTDRFVRIPWNGLDDDGDQIANGVYFYKVIARTVDGENINEAIGRMAVIR